MAEQIVEIVNEGGIHARPAALFVKVASQFKADVTVEKDGRQADGRSMMGLITLTAKPGDRLKITTTGDDAEEALNALTVLIRNGFKDAYEN